MGAERLARYGAALAERGLDAALVSQPQDLFYLTGTAQPCNLLVRAQGEPILFARRFGALVREQAWVEDVREGASYRAVTKELRSHGRLGLELDVLPASLYRKVRETLPGWELADGAAPLLALRAVKDAGEIAALRASVALFGAAHEAIATHLAPGIAEHELAGEVERALRRGGHAGIVHQRRWDAALPPEGSLVSGENLARISGGPIAVTGVGLSRAVPFGASRRVIGAGDLVNIDLGLNLAGYHGDIARTYVCGGASDEVILLAERVRRIEDACLAAIRPGVTAGDVYEAGAEAARAAGVADVFQGFGGVHGPYVGHGIGLELDEPPVLGPGAGERLREGMVLAIEPKLMSPAFGAVNLEDDVVVTAGGCELLGDLPRTVFSVVAGSAEPVA
jgi:Xaa-Pro aminopeptidase